MPPEALGVRKGVEMTEKEVKRWLNRGKSIDEEIKALESECERAFNMATNAVNRMCGERVQTSKHNNSEELYIAYAEYRGLIDECISELYRVKKEILDTVEGMENGVYRQLLILRYIRFFTWERIAEEMGYDIRWVYRLHGRALYECGQHISK